MTSFGVRMSKVIIIGSGIAGMASALRMKKKGYDVEVFEANLYPGGKLSQFEQGGFRFDAGPSLFTKPELVTELFRLFDRDPDDYFQFTRKEVICNYFWEDGTRFSVTGDLGSFARNAAESFGVEERVVIDYLKRSGMKYKLTAPLFLEQSLHKLKTYLSLNTLKALIRTGSMDIFSSLDEVNQKSIGEPHLVQLFNRYATYNGSSPYKTPGIMSMIPHLEMKEGTYFPKGGMISITNSLLQLAKDNGVRFHFGEAVNRIIIRKGKAVGVQTDTGEHECDYVVSNSDIYSTYKKLIPDQKQPEKILKQERSSSGLIFYWGVKGVFKDLDLHNIFFSQDYPEEFSRLFDQKQIHDDPTVYVNITSKEEPKDASKGHENWFVMINAPGDFGQKWEEEIPKARANIIKKISRNLGVDIGEKIVSESYMDPRIIERRTNSHSGALYGTASNTRNAAFLRHPNFSRTLKNLFFCGGSVHPGGGIPLCLYSAKIVSDLIPEAQ